MSLYAASAICSCHWHLHCQHSHCNTWQVFVLRERKRPCDACLRAGSVMLLRWHREIFGLWTARLQCVAGYCEHSEMYTLVGGGGEVLQNIGVSPCQVV